MTNDQERKVHSVHSTPIMGTDKHPRGIAGVVVFENGAITAFEVKADDLMGSGLRLRTT